MTHHCWTVIAMLGALTLGGVPRAAAGTSIVRGPALQALGTNPAIGQGYDLKSNQLESICFDRVVTTKPSYDFDYTISRLDTKSLDQMAKRSYQLAIAADEFHRRFISAPSVASPVPIHQQRLLVMVSINVYYANLDENQSTLSAPTAALLKAGGLPAFFDTCGTHYVRSASRLTALVAVLTYETPSGKPDAEVEEWLKAEIRGFQTRPGTTPPSTPCSAECQAIARTVTVETHGFGMAGAEQRKVAFDPKAFQKTVKSVFQVTQPDDNGGVVTAIEVTPWTEHPAVRLASPPAPAP